jgi:hypothetical protein
LLGDSQLKAGATASHFVRLFVTDCKVLTGPGSLCECGSFCWFRLTYPGYARVREGGLLSSRAKRLRLAMSTTTMATTEAATVPHPAEASSVTHPAAKAVADAAKVTGRQPTMLTRLEMAAMMFVVAMAVEIPVSKTPSPSIVEGVVAIA